MNKKLKNLKNCRNEKKFIKKMFLDFKCFANEVCKLPCFGSKSITVYLHLTE
jgi:hypothetical protein